MQPQRNITSTSTDASRTHHEGSGNVEEAAPFANIDKGVVLQEKRIFGDPKVKPLRCCQLLTKILYLVVQGERFTKKEATDVFFSVTKLFQSKEMMLRRMVYLVLKELAPLAEQDHVIIVIASLTKDMTSTVDSYRANSIRVLTRIAEASMLQQVERYLKQSIVDKEPYVQSAALIAGVHLNHVAPEIVKRWVNEVQQALSSRSPMVQYHALGLLHEIKKRDRLALTKLASSLTKSSSSVRSPYAACLLVRFCAQVMAEDPAGDNRAFFDFLEASLRHKSEIVVYEAARTICSLPGVTSRELAPSITVLQLFLSSPKATLRFAAVRTLNRVAMTFPAAVAACNLDMENLITDVNRSIATLAITTLLKTGRGHGIERLMKQIQAFMSDITDEFKVVVVDAIRGLALKFPEKHRVLMGFLATALRDEGGFPFKRSIVEAILEITRAIPEAKEAGLSHLCEFIEDCEFSFLSNKILHVLGSEGPGTKTPSKFIRYIYNRVSLENAPVRASAVVALAKFGIAIESLRPAVRVLLRRTLHDVDDEVRDRAAFFLAELDSLDEGAQGTPTLLHGADSFGVPLSNMEASLIEYVKAPKSSTPFQLSMVSSEPSMREKDAAAKSAIRDAGEAAGLLAATNTPLFAGAAGPGLSGLADSYAAAMSAVPELADLGKPATSSRPSSLTETETEYVVTVIKHLFANGSLVLQFSVTNTLAEQLLEQVEVVVRPSGSVYAPTASTKLETLSYGAPGVVYVRCDLNSDGADSLAAAIEAPFQYEASLRFQVREIDPSTNEPDDMAYDDEYILESIDVRVADFFTPTFVTDFGATWEGLGEGAEVTEAYALAAADSLQGGVKLLLGLFGLGPAEGSDSVPDKKKKHILYATGTFFDGSAAAVRVRMRQTPEQVLVEVTARSADYGLSSLLAGAVA
eukprot:CAMPEP_0170750244 /NCGR_PEP_ID=MMETSP0437-20130122/10824_1 /TAXON_ID=0 /ORGANISM="Sexangularia sp." /LENGTH=919 /DNA_ID=CAMNT_0011089219 /DNA_START=57 /DNA_END=2816 /DNA_ORIENTATION=+